MIELTDDERSERIRQGGIAIENTDIGIETEVIIGDTLERGIVTKIDFLGVSGACVVKITVGKCNKCNRIRFIDELEKI